MWGLASGPKRQPRGKFTLGSVDPTARAIVLKCSNFHVVDNSRIFLVVSMTWCFCVLSIPRPNCTTSAANFVRVVEDWVNFFGV